MYLLTYGGQLFTIKKNWFLSQAKGEGGSDFSGAMGQT
jgi:hypothetical protein